MSKTSKINIGLFVLGIIGFFYVSELFMKGSILWYFINIVSIFMLIIGVIMLQIKWGGKRKQEPEEPRDDYDPPPQKDDIF